MKFLYFNDFKLGVLKGGNVVEITDLLSDIPVRDSRDLINGLIENFDKYKKTIEDYVAQNDGIALKGLKLTLLE